MRLNSPSPFFITLIILLGRAHKLINNIYMLLFNKHNLIRWITVLNDFVLRHPDLILSNSSELLWIRMYTLYVYTLYNYTVQISLLTKYI